MLAESCTPFKIEFWLIGARNQVGRLVLRRRCFAPRPACGEATSGGVVAGHQVAVATYVCVYEPWMASRLPSHTWAWPTEVLAWFCRLGARSLGSILLGNGQGGRPKLFFSHFVLFAFSLTFYYYSWRLRLLQ